MNLSSRGTVTPDSALGLDFLRRVPLDSQTRHPEPACYAKPVIPNPRFLRVRDLLFPKDLNHCVLPLASPLTLRPLCYLCGELFLFPPS